jgi:RNA polymerase sigma-70 factor (ECF subfamily)
MQVAVRILGDINEAAEAVQVGFVNAYLNIGKLKEPERFESWLLRIVTNTAISQVRAAKRRQEKLRPIGDYGNNSNPSIVRESTAKIINSSLEAVRWHVFNARKKLKVLLKEYLE